MKQLTLESVMAEICAENNLTSVSFGMNLKQEPESRFDANVHWEGYTQRGIPCESGFGASLTIALEEALTRATKDRVPIVVEVPTLPPLAIEGKPA